MPPWLTRIAALCLLLVFTGSARADNSLDEIKKRGVLIIGTDATYPPLEQKVGDRYEGFDIDLGTEIAKELGVRVQWENSNFDGIFASLQTRKYDLVMSGVTITDERKKNLAFTRPYLLSGQTIARRKGDTTVNSSSDLTGKTVAVQLSTTGQTAVEKMGLPADRIRKFDTLQDALLEVRNGRASVAIGDLPALVEMIEKGYPELEVVGGIFVKENVGIVVRTGESELLSAVNDALDKIIADGRYARLYAQWLKKPLAPEERKELDAVRGQGTPVSAQTTGSAFRLRGDVLRAAVPLLVRGAGITLLLTCLALLFGIPLGLLIALGRLSGIRLLSLLLTVYVEVLRGTPLLMQVFVIYFVLPAAGVQVPQFAAGVIALSLNAAAYISEIFRAGIESIDRGQMEAARSLGMDYRCAMRWVILPQTLRRVLPPLTNEAVALLKDTSIVSIISITELSRAGREQASNSGAPVTIVVAVAALYLVMTLPLTQLVRWLEVQWQPISRPRPGKKTTP